MKYSQKFFLVCALLGLSSSGCSLKNNAYIDEIDFGVSDNLEIIDLAIRFTPKIKTDFVGGFAIQNYGYIYINPYTPTSLFEVGMQLNTAIFTDKVYSGISPTTVLPNGEGLGAPYALVQISAPAPISDNFDVYGYVDVLKGAWLGFAFIITKPNLKYFPDNLSLSLIFKKDSAGVPILKGSVFGAKKNSNGEMAHPAGFALLANVKKLNEKKTTSALMALKPMKVFDRRKDTLWIRP